MLAYSLLHLFSYPLPFFSSLPPSLLLPECLQGFQGGEAAWLRDLQRAATQRGTWWPAHGHWQKNQHHILSLTCTAYSVALFPGLHYTSMFLVCKYKDGRPGRFCHMHWYHATSGRQRVVTQVICQAANIEFLPYNVHGLAASTFQSTVNKCQHFLLFGTFGTD